MWWDMSIKLFLYVTEAHILQIIGQPGLLSDLVTPCFKKRKVGDIVQNIGPGVNPQF